MTELSEKAKDVLDAIMAGVDFAGQHDEDAVNELVAGGVVRRVYIGAAGLLGVAKLKLVDMLAPTPPLHPEPKG